MQDKEWMNYIGLYSQIIKEHFTRERESERERERERELITKEVY